MVGEAYLAMKLERLQPIPDDKRNAFLPSQRKKALDLHRCLSIRLSLLPAACCLLLAAECSTREFHDQVCEYNLPLDHPSFRQIPFSSSSIQKISKSVDIIILFANAKPRVVLLDRCCPFCREPGTANIISKVRCSH
ncbi:hypothetical protein KC326_g47 [Hortaea werneckii]|nr:hypothetical protein KC326_g47 [Hortaea werneckii]